MPSKPANEVTPDFIGPFSQEPGTPSDPSPPSGSICEAYRELIEQGLARGRNGKAIWQDLVTDRFSGRLSGGKALRAQTSWTATPGSSRHHPHITRAAEDLPLFAREREDELPLRCSVNLLP